MHLRNIFKHPSSAIDYFSDDEHFNKLYPYYIRVLAGRHWTPVKIARAAAGFLANENGKKILDIGSGVGKFCLCAAHYNPGCAYYGFEQRGNLVQCAEDAKQKLQLENVYFTHTNMTEVNFMAYDHFYFFNSFYEHLEPDVKIDRNIQHSFDFYEYYSRYLFEQLEKLPPGTKLCTYFGRITQVPQTYELLDTLFDEKLKFWVKK